MKKILGMLVLLIGLCAATAWYNPNFLAPTNLQNLTRQIAMLAILAIGEGIVILSGGIDLSVGSVIAFGGLLVVYASTMWGLNPFAATCTVLMLCAIIGLWHSWLICRLRLQPFIVTLCSMLILRGLGRRIAEDQAMGLGIGFPEFRLLGTGNTLGIPNPVLILAFVAIAAAFFLHHTKFGRYLFAIGRNENAVAYSGVNVSAMKTLSYVVCAVLAGVSSTLYAAYTNSVQPASTGQAYELYAIAAAVLGGCSMRAGEGSIFGIIVGASILKTLTNGINLVGVSTLWEVTVIGTVILAGVIADSLYKRRSASVDAERSLGKREAASAKAAVVSSAVSDSPSDRGE